MYICILIEVSRTIHLEFVLANTLSKYSVWRVIFVPAKNFSQWKCYFYFLWQYFSIIESRQEFIFLFGQPMVFRLDGCSFHYARIWSKSSISICWRHLVTSKVVKIDFFSRQDLFYFIRAQHVLSYHLI